MRGTWVCSNQLATLMVNCLFKTSSPAGSCLSHCKGPGVADSVLFPDWMVHYFRRKREPTSSAPTRRRCYLRMVSFLILLLTFKRVLWTLLPKITFRTDAASRPLSLEVKGHTQNARTRKRVSSQPAFKGAGIRPKLIAFAAVAKHHDQKQLMEGRVCFGLQFQTGSS